MAAEKDFQEAVERVRAAIGQFTQGDAMAYQACWSHPLAVTIYGAWGAYERGWPQVRPRLAWAAARFAGGTTSFEELACLVSGDLAASIWLETYVARLDGGPEARPFVLRVTHLYRREEGCWKVIHRHADASIDKIEAHANLPRS